MPVNKRGANPAKGFTLIELVASIVVAALAFTALANFLYNKSTQAIEPIFQIRAAKLGEALMDEILSRPYDQNTAQGGTPACDAVGGVSCSPTPFTADPGEFDGGGNPVRELFNDVDDYNEYCQDPPIDVEDALGNQYGDGNSLEDFENFKMSICVDYDGDYDGNVNEVGDENAKLIVIKIFPPGLSGQGPAIEFKAYRGNF